MAELSVGGERVHFRESGHGPPVVLLHSGGSTGAQWKGVAERLAGRYRLITPDLHGYGGTAPWPGPPETRTVAAEARLVRAVLAHAGAPAHLVGHSYGGGIALELVTHDPPPLRSLALFEPFALSLLRADGEAALHSEVAALARGFIARARSESAEAAWRAYLDFFNAPGYWQALPAEAQARFIAMTDALLGGWSAGLEQALTPAQCRAIALPTLLVAGEATNAPYRRMTELLARHIPRAWLELLPGAGHMAPLTHPAQAAALLEAHLDAA